jgi:hypothetical protein
LSFPLLFLSLQLQSRLHPPHRRRIYSDSSRECPNSTLN